MALVTRTLEYKNDIEGAIESIPGAKEKLQSIIPGRAMRLLMIYDLILGNGKISGGGKAARACKDLKDQLLEKLASVKKAKDESEASLTQEPVKRWVRVNTIKTTIQRAEQELKDFVTAPATPSAVASPSSDKQDAKESNPLKRKQDISEDTSRLSSESSPVSRDLHVDNLLLCIAPPGLAFYSHPRVQDGSWILQDKAR
jgi:16S rRNA C967 or C1407 C5-methylase (RsmB/RsmF family)